MKRRRLAATCALAAGVSCGPVAGPPPSPVPVNSCPEHACTAYQTVDPVTCSGGMCVTNSSLDFTLVVSLPESSFFAPGMTVPIPSFASAAGLNPCGLSTSAFPEATCFRIPQVVEPVGELLVENQVIVSANASGSYIDTTGNPDAGTAFTQWSLPVHVQYRPRWPIPLPSPSPSQPSVSPVEAASLGLPLAPTESTILATSFPGVGAPRGTTATQWRAPLAPGFYERDIVPDNAAFPVITDSIQVGNDEYSQPLTSVAAQQFTVNGGAQSLAGFVVYVRDATTLRRVSSSVTMGTASSESITLLTLSLVAGPQFELVVAPPDGSPIPYLADPVPPGGLGKGNESFPALPVPVAVSGTVVGADLASIQASLVIDSVGPSPSVGGIVTVLPPSQVPAAPFLHYSTTAQTDANGHYAVTLPPGTYDVFVTPSTGSNAGASSVPLNVGVPITQPDGGTEPSIAAGKDLQAAALGFLTGIATIADGRPLAGATVQAQPAVSLAATAVDPRRWPRAQTTTTDATGAFSMPVDPGTYDVVVQPANGTGFPWTTLSTQVVAPGKTLALPPMVIPLPQLMDVVLHDPGDNPLVQAIVRAFAPASGAVPATPGGPLPMIEIGSWMTDTSGHLTMLLAPPH